MYWQAVFDELGVRIASRAQLVLAGASARVLTAAVAGGHLFRLRRDHYALPGTGRHIAEAVRVGGRLGCVSALAEAGLFAADTTFTHVHLDRSASRTRHPRDRFVRLTARERDGLQTHWSALIDPSGASEYSVGIPDALAQVLACQEPWRAVASIDSALFLGAVAEGHLTDVFAHAPARAQPLRALLDGRAESGQESVLRMIVRSAGLDCELQVSIAGVGRVDLVVEGVLVLEADSRLAHDGWELHVRDRDRDLALAQLGYMSLRPVYQRTMYTPDDVRKAILHLLAVNKNFRVHL
jgi:very-short-patch-repair endonuclease